MVYGERQNSQTSERGKQMRFPKLRGRIIEKYGTLKAFSEAIGISTAGITLRMQGKVQWRLTDIAKACRLLDIPGSEINIYFLPECMVGGNTPNEDNA